MATMVISKRGRIVLTAWCFLFILAFISIARFLRPFPSLPLFFPGFSTLKDNIPHQVHISLAGPGYMRVSWVTSSFSSPSTVEYGTSSGSYNSMAIGESTSYSYLFYKSGFIHHVVIGPLESNQAYYYQCGGAGIEYVLRTPPNAGSQESVTFAIVGDLGQTDWTVSTLGHIEESKYDVLIIPGDLSYADYYQPRWDSFGELVEPWASSRPWMVTAGNHDVERVPLLISPFKAYNSRWRMPFAESGSDSNTYYSFEVAGAHVLMLASYTDTAPHSNQCMWMKADLASVNRTRTPWVFAVVHAPWYNTNAKHQGDGDQMMEDMESILKEAKVDIIFAGHVHAYERTARMYRKQVDPCGIHYITIGDGGTHEGLAQRFLDPKPEWSVYREACFGHGELQVVNATHARWTLHRNEELENAAADEVWFQSLSSPGSMCTGGSNEEALFW